MKELYDRSPPSRGDDGYYHPASEDDLVALVRLARSFGGQLRVRGAAHSVPAAIATDRGPRAAPDARHVDVMLDRYVRVTFDDERRQVTAQAGCHLGHDPRDPTRTSRWENSLLAQLDARAWALPDLGGVTHQTVAGFFATGSSGGSVRHALSDAVVAWRMIDGRGRARDVRRERDDDFDAHGCSLGLLGVISTVTIQCVARYDVVGREDITGESASPPALFGDGADGLEGFLRDAEYARLFWWPQEGVRRVVTWQARRMVEADYDARTGPPGALRPKEYSALGDMVTDPRLRPVANLASQAAAGIMYDGIAQASARLGSGAPRGSLARRVGALVRPALTGTLLSAALREFVPLSPTQHFWDSWCHGLPMDNQISERWLPTEFTEIWLPLERAGEAMRALRAHFDRGGYSATGAFICEVYAARRTAGWMHPGYGRDSVRIDLFWFGRNAGDPTRGWFVQFWELLRPFAYRLHWGKHLPADPALGHAYLRQHTPRWDDFLSLRARLDPDDVFLTRYWRTALGIGA
ncbi:MAG: FAD-binding protein [Deltaproteobacteria bacterium]|nr:FAD-binding protein [Myxococcales bacterium]MDP3213100.1 FAD-binding protein [Deltaproteobacteria bacterium]